MNGNPPAPSEWTKLLLEHLEFDDEERRGWVADIGTGPGTVALELLKQGATHLVATEIDPRWADLARRRLSELSATRGVIVEVVHADLLPDDGRLFRLAVFNPPTLPRLGDWRNPAFVAEAPDGFGTIGRFLNMLERRLELGGRALLVLPGFHEDRFEAKIRNLHTLRRRCLARRAYDYRDLLERFKERGAPENIVDGARRWLVERSGSLGEGKILLYELRRG